MAKISNERKTIYYVGLVLIIIGFIVFISTFFLMFSDSTNSLSGFNNNELQSDFGSSINIMGGIMTRAIIGFILMIIGAILMNLGSKGLAGSGLVLDPEQAREDLKPFNQAKGKMINDVIENIDVLDDFKGGTAYKEIIKIKCRNCRELNDEDSKYCKSCASVL